MNLLQKDSAHFYFETWIKEKEYNLDSLLILYADDELDSLTQNNWKDFDLETRIKELYLSQFPNIQYKDFSFLLWKIKGKDQRFRTYSKYNSPKLKREAIFLDSLLKVNILKYMELTANSLNFQRKDELILMNWMDENGYPTISKVGKIASQTAFLVIQHSDDKYKFKRCLKLMKKAMKTNDINFRDYAMMYDRYLILFTKRKQLYATQQLIKTNDTTLYYQPIRRLKKVNKRRAKMGMEPIQIEEIKIGKP